MAAVWLEISVEVPGQYGEAVANFLIENGAPGIGLEERGDRTVLIAHFADDLPLASLRRFCADLLGDACGGQPAGIRVRRIAEEDWAENWKLHFPPQLVGERLCICPSWTPAPPDRVTVVLDPGMAFGTGHHATTRGCLLLLEAAVRQGRIARALDVGTGSGVLAIALAKLGVREVSAIDTDPTARAVAEANVARNGVAGSVSVASTLDAVHGTFDLVTANLFATLLSELASRLTRALHPSGRLICSGFLVDDEPAVRGNYEAQGLQVGHRYEEHRWVTLAFKRREAA